MTSLVTLNSKIRAENTSTRSSPLIDLTDESNLSPVIDLTDDVDAIMESEQETPPIIEALDQSMVERKRFDMSLLKQTRN